MENRRKPTVITEAHFSEHRLISQEQGEFQRIGKPGDNTSIVRITGPRGYSILATVRFSQWFISRNSEWKCEQI
jgi:hypothetical protein